MPYTAFSTDRILVHFDPIGSLKPLPSLAVPEVPRMQLRECIRAHVSAHIGDQAVSVDLDHDHGSIGLGSGNTGDFVLRRLPRYHR